MIRFSQNSYRNAIGFLTEDFIPSASMFTAWRVLALRRVKDLNRRSKLGFLWVVLTSAFFIVMLSFVYSSLFNVTLREFIPYVSVGIVIWQFVQTTILSMPTMFVGYSLYLLKRKLPLSLFIISNLLEKMIVLLFQFSIVVLICVIFQTPVTPALLLLPISVILLLFILLGITGIVMPIGTKYRDFGQLLSSIMVFMFLVTPILWDPSLLDDRLFIATFNPIYHMINVIRAPIVDGLIPIQSLIACFGIGILCNLIGLVILGRSHRRLIFWV